MKKTLISLAIASMAFVANAEVLRVVYLDANETSYVLSQVQYIDFRNTDNFTVVGKDGTALNTSDYSKTRRIDFTSGDATESENEMANANLVVTPNPTQDALQIIGIEPNSPVCIFSTDGKVLYNVVAGEDRLEIPVSSYAKGTYILKIGKKYAKFIKE